MSDSITPRKCNTCHIEKPLTDFYKNGKYHHGHCKECQKKRMREQKHLAPDVSKVPSENDVISQLANLGIPALPGKALGFHWVDTIAWGCVQIEVKTSKWDGQSFMIWFTAQRNKGHIRGQLVLLVCEYDDHRTYHLFDARNPVFYKDGKIKQGIRYIPDRKSIRGCKSANAMSAEMMTAAKDQWQMIEQWRLKISESLKSEPLALPIAA